MRLHLHKTSLGYKIGAITATFLLQDLLCVFIRAGTVTNALSIFRSMFSLNNPWILFDGSLYNCGLNQKNFSLVMICMINAVLPMELWDQYGIVSHNLGGHGAQLPVTYWVLRLALERYQPRAVVIDCMALESNEKNPPVYSYIHQIMDAMPFGIIKLRAVLDLMNDPEYSGTTDGEKMEPLALLWDFSVYHNRWEDLYMGDFTPSKNKQKGAEAKYVHGTPKSFDRVPDDETLKEETLGMDYLNRMIDLCQSRGIRVMLTFLPFPASETDQRSANTMEKIAAERGVPCVNFLKEAVIEYETDVADANSHVNISGAQKLTTWIGRMLKDQFDLPDQRENPLYVSWQDDYREYLNSLIGDMKKTSSLEQYMLMLTSPHNDAVIELYDRSIYKNKTYASLFENLGVDPDEMTDNADLIVIRGGREATVCHSFKKDGGEADTVLGRMSYRIEDRGEKDPVAHYVISADGEELYALPRSIHAHTDIRIHVYEHDTGKLLLHTSVIMKTQKDFAEDYVDVLEISSQT